MRRQNLTLYPEQKLQIQCVKLANDYFLKVWPRECLTLRNESTKELYTVAPLFHVPNEGKTSGKAGNKLRRMGRVSGVPDLLLEIARGGWHGMRIEMKDSGVGVIGYNQKQWAAHYERQGYLHIYCETLVGFECAVVKYANGKSERRK